MEARPLKGKEVVRFRTYKFDEMIASRDYGALLRYAKILQICIFRVLLLLIAKHLLILF